MRRRKVAVLVGGSGSVGGCEKIPASDRAAISLARLRFPGPLQAYSLNDEEVLQFALAAGAAVSLYRNPDPLDFDLLLVGRGGCGTQGDLLPARIAAQKGCALVLDVLDLSTGKNGLRVVRDLGKGAREVLEVRGPCVLLVSEQASTGRYISRHRRRSADLQCIRKSEGPTPPAPAPVQWEVLKPRAHTRKAPDPGTCAEDRMDGAFGLQAERLSSNEERLISGQPDDAADHLLRYLFHYGFLSADESGQQASNGKDIAAVSPGGDDHSKSSKRGSEKISAGTRQGSSKAPGVRVSEAVMRGPRLLDGAAPGMQRRPRPLNEDELRTFNRRRRAPRRLDGQGQRFRGPYAVPDGPV